MRVLVTGHNGYVGTVLVPMLLKAGHEVVGLDSNLYQAATFGEEDAPAIPAIQRDVRDVTYEAVSYTHLDVYKRQAYRPAGAGQCRQGRDRPARHEHLRSGRHQGHRIQGPD